MVRLRVRTLYLGEPVIFPPECLPKRQSAVCFTSVPLSNSGFDFVRFDQAATFPTLDLI